MLGKKGFASKHKLSLSHDPFSKVLKKKKKKKYTLIPNIPIHGPICTTHACLYVNIAIRKRRARTDETTVECLIRVETRENILYGLHRRRSH